MTQQIFKKFAVWYLSEFFEILRVNVSNSGKTRGYFFKCSFPFTLYAYHSFSFLHSIHSNVEALLAQILISSSCCYFVTWLNLLSLLNLNKYVLHFLDCSAEASRTCFSSLFYRPITYTQRTLQKLFKIVLWLLDCWLIYGFDTEILSFWTHIWNLFHVSIVLPLLFTVIIF